MFKHSTEALEEYGVMNAALIDGSLSQEDFDSWLESIEHWQSLPAQYVLEVLGVG